MINGFAEYEGKMKKLWETIWNSNFEGYDALSQDRLLLTEALFALFLDGRAEVPNREGLVNDKMSIFALGSPTKM